MGKVDFNVAVGFGIQSAEGVISPVLDNITTTWGGDPDGTDEGLLLGDAESGIDGSGLSLTLGRNSRDKPEIGASKTRPISDLLFLDTRTFTFALPFCGNRGLTTVTTPVAADFKPLVGLDALLEGAGLTGAENGVDETYEYFTGGQNLISALVYYYGNRVLFLDCRTESLAVVYDPGNIAILTGTISVGSVKEPAAKGFSLPATLLPALTFGAQSSVSAPVIEEVTHLWKNTRGYTDYAWTLANEILTIKDSNAKNGEVKEIGDQDNNIEATVFVDDTGSDVAYELDQLLSTVSGDLDPMSFQVGDTETSGLQPAVAHSLLFDQPEEDESSPDAGGDKALNTVSLIARGDTEDSSMALTFL